MSGNIALVAQIILDKIGDDLWSMHPPHHPQRPWLPRQGMRDSWKKFIVAELKREFDKEENAP